jgi:hypothetical protein
MAQGVIIDANLMLLLIVGSCDPQLIDTHKNLSGYSQDDFDILGEALALFSDIVLLPHIMAEVSSLARQIRNPARSVIQGQLRKLLEGAIELPAASLDGVRRNESDRLGLTDAVTLAMCTRAGRVRPLAPDSRPRPRRPG